MENSNHIMVDIETLGIRDDATIFQIAAATFDIATGEIKHTFNKTANIGLADDLVVDGETLKWWLKTDKDLLDKLLNQDTDESPADILEAFANYLTDYVDTCLWGNGILFDNMKIKQAMERAGIRYPVYYRNDRDVRTILALAAEKTGYSEEFIHKMVADDSRRKHDAMDDVIHQVELVSYCYRALMEE